MAVEKRWIEPRRIGNDFSKKLSVALIAGGGEPLNLVLVGAGVEAEQFRHRSIQAAEGVRIIPVLIAPQFVAAAVPARPAAEIPGVVERQNGCFLKRRRVESRGGMSPLMFHHHHLGVRKLAAKGQMKIRFLSMCEG